MRREIHFEVITGKLDPGEKILELKLGETEVILDKGRKMKNMKLVNWITTRGFQWIKLLVKNKLGDNQL
jgi:hypothetical protein